MLYVQGQKRGNFRPQDINYFSVGVIIWLLIPSLGEYL